MLDMSLLSQATSRLFLVTIYVKTSRTRGSHNQLSLKSDKELQLEWSCSSPLLSQLAYQNNL